MFNAVQPLRGFVCEDIALVRGKTGAMSIGIELRADERCAARCSCCEQPAPCYDTGSRRHWMFVPLWNVPVRLVYAPRRVDCPRCGVKVEAMSWSEGKHHAARPYMIFLARWARRLSWKETARVFGVSWQMVYRSVTWIVAWGLAHRELEGVEAIGVDELHWGRGKKSGNYVTLIYQIDAGARRLLWVGLSRTERCLKSGFKELGTALQSVKFVCSDMWKPYLKVIATLLPQALNILDRFHIAVHLNSAVDQVRRSEVAALGHAEKAKGRKLKKMRWSLLRRGSRVRGRARARLEALLRSGLATARAWQLKEVFGQFWKYRSVTWAMGFLDAWTERAMRSALEPMKKVARMLRAHEALLANYFLAKKQFNSGVVEGLNLKCNLVTRRAYGLRTYDALQIALYHNLGKLPEPNLTHQFC